MPRSSRHKSHKERKHSSKDDREYSDTEEDVKMKDRKGKEEGSVRVSRDPTSGEKRKVASRDGNDLGGHGNGDVLEEYVVSKRRKEKADAASASSDRWNGSGDRRGDGTTTDKEAKGESFKLESDKSSKSKGSSDLKSKTRGDGITSDKEAKAESFKLESDKSSKSKGSSDLKSKARGDGITSDKEAKDESVKLESDKSSKSKGSNDLKSKTRGDGITTDKEAKGETFKLESDKSSKSKGSSDLKSRIRGDGITTDKEAKGESFKLESDKSLKSKGSGDLKGKTSRRHDNVCENQEDMRLEAEKGDFKNGSEVDLKRKSEKDSRRKEVRQHKDSKELKDNERELERGRKVQDTKRDVQARPADEATRKQELQSADLGKERLGKQGSRENTVGVQDELRNPDLEKELEKQIGKRRDGSSDKDKHQDHAKEIDDRRLSSRGERVKDDRNSDEKHKDDRYSDEKQKDGSHGDKLRDEGKRDNRHRDNKYREDDDMYNRYGDDKYREDVKRDNRHRDDKYREDGGRDNRQRDDKYREEGDRGNRHRDDKYREESDRDNRHRDDKCREGGDRDNRHRDDKCREGGDRDNRHRDDKYREGGDRDNRHRDDKYWKHNEREDRHREDKHQEDVDRENRHRVGKQRDDSDRDQRLRDLKYRDEHTSRDRTSDRSDTKHSRDEGNAGDFCYRKSSNCDGSPIDDDRSTKYNHDKGKRKANDREDKEDHNDMRYRSTKEQRSDEEKKSASGAKLESVTDRERSYSRNVDMEISLNHNRRNSPSFTSHAAKDHYRLPKQEGSKYRDYLHEERVWHEANSTKEFAGVAEISEKASVSRSMENHFPKDDSHLGELSVEKRRKSVSRPSSFQQVDKSPSPSSTDRRHLNKSEVRRSLDMEETGQRSGGFRDAKVRGSRELPMETLPGYELPQADGDTSSVSSPFSRTSHLPSNSKSSLPPPPPFRSGIDNPLAFNTLEDDNRGKSINRHRRMGDSNMGRAQGSGWKGVPNWPSPVANGFMPFQHGPPPVGFHPLMHHFSSPPMFGIRPSMELHHNGVPYHIPDADRFSGHGRTLGWQNPVDDSCPPPLRGWDANNVVFDESRIYGRQGWDNNRTLTTGRGWETSGDMWKGQNGGLGTELLATPRKENHSAAGPADEFLTDESGPQAHNEQNQPGLKAENLDINQSSVAVVTNILEAPQALPVENPSISKPSTKNGDHFWHVYLSKLDISADLTQPELFDQCTSLMDMDHNTNYAEDNSKILCVEEVMGAKVTISNKTSSTSLFAAINDSVFQKAMSLYMKQREEIGVINGERVLISNVENLKSVPTSDQEKVGSSDDKLGELDLDCDSQEVEDSVSDFTQDKVELPNTFQNLEVSPATTNQKADEPVQPDNSKKSEPLLNLSKLQMEVDPVRNQEMPEYAVEDKSSSPENVEQSIAQSPGKAEDVSWASDARGNPSVNNNNEEQKLVDTKSGLLLFSDVSCEAREAVMPESIESGLVNLSWIHHSPESTH